LVNFQIKNIPGDLISKTIVSQIAEILGNVTSGYIYYKMGPVKSHIIMSTLAICGSVILLFVWFGNHPYLILGCIMLSKFGLGAVFNMCYIDICVLTPPILTATILGICKCSASIFASMSSIAAELDHVVVL
jgi:predicted MFS family arabinose efflux permease